MVMISHFNTTSAQIPSTTKMAIVSAEYSQSSARNRTILRKIPSTNVLFSIAAP